MRNAFRSTFFVTAILTIITLPAIFVGFFPITLIMGLISAVSLVLWLTMRAIISDTSMTGPRPYIKPVDKSKIVVGDVESNKNDTNIT